MEWTKPRWTEIPVGMEIGAYRAPEPEEIPHAGPQAPDLEDVGQTPPQAPERARVETDRAGPPPTPRGGTASPHAPEPVSAPR